MRTALLAPVVCASIGVLAWVDSDSGIEPWVRLRGDLEVVRERVAGLEAETETLRLEIAALESRPFALERAIREDLGLARPGETVIRFGAAESAAAKRPRKR